MESKKINVEYLIIIETGSSQVCNSIETFENLLKTNGDLEIDTDQKTISYQKQIKANYQLKTDEIKGKKQRYFYLIVEFSRNEATIEKDIENYMKLLRAIRKCFGSIKKIEPLWDDISLYYSQKSYPLIYEIENLMRKLLTYFMLTKIGERGIEETLPQTVKDDIGRNKGKSESNDKYMNTLYSVDFIQLKNMLFDQYPQNSNIEELRRKINEAQKVNDLKLEELKVFVPKSNWERYFDKQKIVQCSSQELNKEWDSLYNLRCKVAHNRLIGKDDYENISKLVIKLKVVLQEAIDNIDKIIVPIDEQEVVAESVASNINSLYGEFIICWKKIESNLLEKLYDLDIFTDPEKKRPLFMGVIIDLLIKTQRITKDQYNKGKDLCFFRNKLVHHPDIILIEDEILFKIKELENYYREIIESLKPKEEDEKDEE